MTKVYGVAVKNVNLIQDAAPHLFISRSGVMSKLCQYCHHVYIPLYLELRPQGSSLVIGEEKELSNFFFFYNQLTLKSSRDAFTLRT